MDTVCNCSLLVGHKEEGGMKSQHDFLGGLIMDMWRQQEAKNTMAKKEHNVHHKNIV